MANQSSTTNSVITQAVSSIDTGALMSAIGKGVKETPGMESNDGVISGLCIEINDFVSGIPLVGEAVDKLKLLIAPVVPALGVGVGAVVGVGGTVLSAAAPVAGGALGGVIGTAVPVVGNAMGASVGGVGGAVVGGVIGAATSSLSKGATDLTVGLLQPGSKSKAGVGANDLLGVVVLSAESSGINIDPQAKDLSNIFKGVELKGETLQPVLEVAQPLIQDAQKTQNKPIDPADAALGVSAKSMTFQAEKFKQEAKTTTSESLELPEQSNQRPKAK